MWTAVVVMAVCVAVMGGVAMIGTGGLKGNPVQAAIMFVAMQAATIWISSAEYSPNTWAPRM